MSEELVHDGGDRRNGASRRAALKAGVGVGVGLVAWSGPTITSLGGTPAYALGCTFVVRINLSGGCSNIDSGGGLRFRVPPARRQRVSRPATASPTPSLSGVCCGTVVSTLTFPEGFTCVATIRFNGPPNCTGPLVGLLRFGPESDGSLDISFDCLSTVPPANTQYQVIVTCNTTNAPLECLE